MVGAGLALVVVPTAVIAGGVGAVVGLTGLTGLALWKLLRKNGPTISLEHVRTVIDTEPHARVENLRRFVRQHYKMPRFLKLELYIRRGEERVLLENGQNLATYGITSANGATVYANIRL